MPVLVALVALGFVSSFVGLVLGYVVLWALVAHAIDDEAPLSVASERAGPYAPWALTLVLALFFAGPRISQLLDHEGLSHLRERSSDRAETYGPVALAPRLVAFDRPSTFYLAGPRGGSATLTLEVTDGDDAPVHRTLEAEEIVPAGSPPGDGLYRVSFDPRVHGLPVTTRVDGEQRVEVLARIGDHERRLSLHAHLATPHPRRTRVDATRSRACIVSEESDEVVLFELGVSPRRVRVDDGPTDCLVEGEETWVVHRHTGSLVALGREGEVRRRRVLGAGLVAVGLVESASRPSLVVARTRPMDTRRGELLFVDVEGELEVRSRHALAGQPVLLATHDESVVVATSGPSELVRIAEREGARLVSTRALRVPPTALAITPDGAHVTLTATDFATEREPERQLGNHYVEDRMVTLALETLDVEADVPTGRRTARQDHAGDLDRGLGPTSLSYGPRGLLVSFEGSDELGLFASTGPRYVTLEDIDAHPPSDAVELADGSWLVASAASGRVVRLASDFHDVIETIALMPDDRELLRNDASLLRIRFGERAFAEATRSGVSCQSCHARGGSDEGFHNIGGRRAVPTLDVRGIIGTSPFLRDGSYLAIGDLHEVADEEYRGYRRERGDRAQTIQAFVEDQPRPFVRPDAGEPRVDALSSGFGVFLAAGCAECHRPPTFTTLSPVAAARLFPDVEHASPALDVPSLLGVAASPPYLADGRAATLESIFEEHDPAGRHGGLGDRSPEARAALMAFVRSLR